MEWTEILTALVAIYAAGLSTYTLVVSRIEKRRLIKIEVSNGFITQGPEASELMLLMRVLNPGDRTVTIGCPAIRLPSGESLVFTEPLSDVRFPHDLEEGKNCLVWTEIPGLAKQLSQNGFSGVVKIVVECRDAVGNLYVSEPWSMDVSQWT